QIIEWGTADIFNPMSVVNSYDLEDRLESGKKVANEMVVLSITPDVFVEGDDGSPILDELNLTLVAVPYFKSGLVPEYALSAFGSGAQFRRFVNSPTLIDLLDVLDVFESKGGLVEFRDPMMDEPDFRLENTQLAA